MAPTLLLICVKITRINCREPVLSQMAQRWPPFLLQKALTALWNWFSIILRQSASKNPSLTSNLELEKHLPVNNTWTKMNSALTFFNFDFSAPNSTYLCTTDCQYLKKKIIVSWMWHYKKMIQILKISLPLLKQTFEISESNFVMVIQEGCICNPNCVQISFAFCCFFKHPFFHRNVVILISELVFTFILIEISVYPMPIMPFLNYHICKHKKNYAYLHQFHADMLAPV